MNEKLIGDRIKKLRKNKNITLNSLAKMTGYTSGYLSRIENAEKAPPISTLSKIAKALNVDISFLMFEENSNDPKNMVIVRKDDPKDCNEQKASYGYIYEALASKKIGKNMEPYILYPDFEYSTVFQHEGEEFFYILEGQIEFIYGDQKYLLNAGDCMYFDAHIPHTGISKGKSKAKVLIIIYSYKRP